MALALSSCLSLKHPPKLMPLNWCDILMLFISCINDWLKIWPTNIMLQRLFEYQFITAVTSPNVAYTLFSFES